MKPQSQRALRMLRDAGDQGVSTGEFAEAGILRFGARLAELREAGHHITTRRVTSNRFRYFLHGSPQVRAAEMPAGSDLGGPHIPTAHTGATGAQANRTDGDTSTSPPCSTPAPESPGGPSRVYRGDPGFSYDHPPTVASGWEFHMNFIPGRDYGTYWQLREPAQRELAAA